MPEITIVITAYNLQAYLDQCLQEFMAQTFQDFDVLIVDCLLYTSSARTLESAQSKGRGVYPHRFVECWLALGCHRKCFKRKSDVDRDGCRLSLIHI